ncbi:unnamed protein product [Adineta ricciae]|uniref:Uncharacterized protein n=2 Tax=Adineta ricciae TaxID=249248 RepID=A0A815T3E3_ADIRI|nr:unnamed protein product [Adineta ricciae]
MNITSNDLYLWSTSIDTIEQYEIYLETKDFSLSKWTFYNCTLPRFGSKCQYEFSFYHENYSSLYEMIYDYYFNFTDTGNQLTCYTHLKCHRGLPPACLDWTEICDGKVDCLDGNFDEEHCWQLELNECQSNEYQCNMGQCIPYEFVRDDRECFDCIDGSDEEHGVRNDVALVREPEPSFGYDDIRCETDFLSRSCEINRHFLLSKSMFSVKDNSVTDECWSALKCYFGLLDSSIDNDINGTCIPMIKKTCPDMLYVPNVPVFFGHIYTAYKKDDIQSIDDYTLPYLCSNRSFHFGSLDLISDVSMKNTKCFKISRFDDWWTKHGSTWYFRYFLPITDIYNQLKEMNPIINFPVNRCNQSNIYQCRNSSKCISFHRLINDISDCPYFDDEDISENTNSQLFVRLKHKFYKCHFTNRYILLTAIEDGKCDCGYLDKSFCEDESKYKTFVLKTISFQTICDHFHELYPVTIDGQKQTDESECEQWECDNIYTHCDGIWNCFDGKDENNCDSFSDFFSCSSQYRICVTRDTSEFTCLPMSQMNDGEVDCLGGTDEKKLCQFDSSGTDIGGFQCMINGISTCLRLYRLCNDQKDCSYGDDEQFCLKNRSLPMLREVCEVTDPILTSNVEKFLCNTTAKRTKRQTKQFTITGFHETSANEGNPNKFSSAILFHDDHSIRPDKRRCLRGVDLRIWLNHSSNHFTSTCLCPPNYYGNQCQYQNQRVSLVLRFKVSAQSRQTLFAIIIMLIANTNQRMIHSYEQLTYLSIRDCQMKFNLYLFYSTRPKPINQTYSIHIDIYDKTSLQYRASFSYSVNFSFLPVHRLAFIVNIPFENDREICSNKQCLHGTCTNYLNTKKTFCQCKQGWSGEYCHIPHDCNCSANSLCVGSLNDNRSICICRENYFGSRCYLRYQICDKFSCENDGLCIPHDDFMLSSAIHKYFCICPKGFSGNRCQFADSEINLIFDEDIHLSHSVFIHFFRIILLSPLRVIPKASPQRSTALQTVSQPTNSIRIYWAHPFHLIFTETLDKNYYFTVLQPIFNHSIRITRQIRSSHRCPSIDQLTNETFAQLHVLRRIKSYHLICQTYSSDFHCFYDDLHLCLCYDFQGKRLANCFEFDHHMKFDCYGQNHCENNGQCFQDSPDCPKRSLCVCRSCYYGNRCQFTTNEFGLSLDAILVYHIIQNVDIFHQTSMIKISSSLTILFVIIGLLNGIISLITFKNKSVLKVGCGIYLFGSSITTIITMIFLGLKYFIYLSIQMSTLSNRIFLQIQCYSLDFLLQICLNMDQWLNACVSIERAITVIQGIRFVKKKSKQLAKKVVTGLLILIVLTSLHDPIYRRLFEEKNEIDEEKKRIWCIVKYSPKLQIYTRVVNTFHFFVPFLLNLISSVLLIIETSRQKLRLSRDQTPKEVLHEQIREHQHLLIAPIVLFLLALPRLILSYISKCMSSSKDSYLFLSAYFISFLPAMMIVFIFILPSKFYRNEYQKSISQLRTQIQQHLRRTN